MTVIALAPGNHVRKIDFEGLFWGAGEVTRVTNKLATTLVCWTNTETDIP